MNKSFSRFFRPCYVVFIGVVSLLFAVTVVQTLAMAAATSVLVVTNTNDSGAGSLREVLAIAQAGDVITFDSAVSGTILLTTGPLSVVQAITIIGPATAVLTISGNHTFQILNSPTSLTLTNLTLADGYTTGDGGGLQITGTAVLTNVRFINNMADDGGGLHLTGEGHLVDVLFQNNTAFFPYPESGAYASGTIRLKNVSFLDNNYGGLYVKGKAIVEDSLFQGNEELGIYSEDYGQLVITNSQFIQNEDSGIAVRYENVMTIHHSQFISNGLSGLETYAGGVLTISDSLFQGNQDSGLSLYYITTTLTNTQFIDNFSPYSGGAIYGSTYWNQFDQLHITGGLFQGNQATSSGGAIYYLGSNLVVSGTQFINNSSAGDGGGILGLATLLTNTQFISNSAIGSGGGLSAIATITGGLFQGNQASYGAGAELFDSQLLNTQLINTQFINNSATVHGGGLRVWGYTSLTNLLFTGNNAPAGAALAFWETDPGYNSTIQHVTIASPELVDSSAIYVLTGTVGITNTLIANYAVGIEAAGGTVHQDYSLFAGNTTDIIGVVSGGEHNPNGPANFVSPSQGNYRPGEGSAAINTGLNTGVLFDIEGNPRPLGLGVEIGAYEVVSPYFELYLPFLSKR